jgi:hypothetical protein
MTSKDWKKGPIPKEIRGFLPVFMLGETSFTKVYVDEAGGIWQGPVKVPLSAIAYWMEIVSPLHDAVCVEQESNAVLVKQDSSLVATLKKGGVNADEVQELKERLAKALNERDKYTGKFTNLQKNWADLLKEKRELQIKLSKTQKSIADAVDIGEVINIVKSTEMAVQDIEGRVGKLERQLRGYADISEQMDG